MSVYEREREAAPIFSPVKQISILQILARGRVCVYMREKEGESKKNRPYLLSGEIDFYITDP